MPSTRRIFIGDIQGCRSELETLLETLRFDPSSDRLEPVGDLVNRGPDSLGALRLLKRLGAGGVLGNHDVHLLRVAKGKRSLGKRDTLDALLAADDRDELLRWLEVKPFVAAADDVLLVHAALNPQWTDPVAELAGANPYDFHAAVEFATRARHCGPRGERPNGDERDCKPPFKAWYEHWLERSSDPRTVVFGHWAMQGLVERPRLRGLDTGCVWGGKLTAWIAEEDRLVQVPAERRWAEFD